MACERPADDEVAVSSSRTTARETNRETRDTEHSVAFELDNEVVAWSPPPPKGAPPTARRGFGRDLASASTGGGSASTGVMASRSSVPWSTAPRRLGLIATSASRVSASVGTFLVGGVGWFVCRNVLLAAEGEWMCVIVLHAANSFGLAMVGRYVQLVVSERREQLAAEAAGQTNLTLSGGSEATARRTSGLGAGDVIADVIPDIDEVIEDADDMEKDEDAPSRVKSPRGSLPAAVMLSRSSSRSKEERREERRSLTEASCSSEIDDHAAVVEQ